jgi:segregation and condensation protein A
MLRLQLDEFEGPFEVLLYLIKEQEIDIFDIPILQVTQQYLSFLDLLRLEQIDVAGDFLVMAATLIQIKSRMILPADVEQEEEEDIEEEDPRLELVVKLLEYRKFRDLARFLGDYEQQQSDRFGRRVKPAFLPEEADEEEDIIEVSLYDLIKSVRTVMRFLVGGAMHSVYLESASVDDKIVHIEELLSNRESISWSELRRECSVAVEVVCCLLAILELCRMNRISVHQQSAFGEIRLFARNAEAVNPRKAEVQADVALS